jgi:5-methylcytosine-specific restriction endonuclease McrA
MSLTQKMRGQRLRELIPRFGRICWYCGVDLSYRLLNIDHIVPEKQGGDDDLLNLALTCKSCNFAKNFLSLDEFFTWIDYIRSVNSKESMTL